MAQIEIFSYDFIAAAAVVGLALIVVYLILAHRREERESEEAARIEAERRSQQARQRATEFLARQGKPEARPAKVGPQAAPAEPAPAIEAPPKPAMEAQPAKVEPQAAPAEPAPAIEAPPKPAMEAQPARAEPAPVAPKPAGITEPEPEKRGFFQRLTRAISKTSMVFRRRVMGLVGLGQKISEETLEKLEEAMLEADLGVATTEHIMEVLRDAWTSAEIETTDQILPFIRMDLKERLTRRGNKVNYAQSGTTVVLVVGVNGVGKTTSIAKLARYFVNEGKKVVLAAADTFRAAAVQQLATWGERIGCEVVRGADKQDPASVAFQGAEHALAAKADVLIVDTAGRLHTQKNLMDELTKITRVLGNKLPGAPHETILVLDATTGQNAVTQAEMFKAAANVSGLFLAKLDGTAKGGAVLTINEKVAVPVKFVGLGESFDDIQAFNAETFVDALFNIEEAEARA